MFSCLRTPGQGSGGGQGAGLYGLYGLSARSPPGPDSALQQALGSGQKYYRDPATVTTGHRSVSEIIIQKLSTEN